MVIDAGTAGMGKSILRQLDGRRLSAHALTHAHPDHYGSTNALCQARGLPVWVGEHDASVVEGARPRTADSRAGRLAAKMPIPDPHPVERRLSEGDEVAGFTVLDTPGHSPGHISLWRESDRTLICGDVLFNMKLPLPRPGLREPFAAVTPDPARNRDSARRLAELRPELVLFGHGPPLTDGDRFVRFVESLP